MMALSQKEPTAEKGSKKVIFPGKKDKKIHLSPETEFKENQYVGENNPSWKGEVQTNENDSVYIWAEKIKS